MPRGFEGETSAQEARGNENISESQVDRGRDEADMRSEARDLRNSASPINNISPSINALVNRFTAQYGPLSRGAFNSVYGRNIQNPGGINTLGYGTANVLGKISPSFFGGGVKTTVPQLSGTVFSKKAPGGGTLVKSGGKMMGMSAEDYYSGKSGAGVGRSDLETYQDKYGYATPQERELNRAYDQYMNPYNKLGEPGYNRDVINLGAGEVRPGLQSGIFSNMSGTPTALGPVATYDRNYSGMDNLAMTAFGTMGHLARALTNKVTGIEGQPLPTAALAPTPEMIAQGQTYGGMARSFGQIPGQIKQGIESLRQTFAPNVPAPASGQYDFYTDPEVSVAYPQASVGTQQVAGSLFDSLFRDPNISPEAREILKEKGMTIDDLFAPKTPAPEPEKPDLLDMIRGVTQTSALGGPATANQLAFDATGMSRYGNSYIANNYGIMDKAANAIPGLADTLRSMGIDIATPPTAKIYSPPTSSNAFSRLIGR